MPKCSKCGSDVSENVRFCTNCGAPVNPPQQAEQKPAEAKPEPKPANPPASDTVDIIVPAPEYNPQPVNPPPQYQQPPQPQYQQQPPQYQQQPQYQQPQNDPPEKEMTAWNHFVTLFLISLPIAGFIIFLVWLFGGSKYKQRISFIRGYLIFILMNLVITGVIVALTYSTLSVYIDDFMDEVNRQSGSVFAASISEPYDSVSYADACFTVGGQNTVL